MNEQDQAAIDAVQHAVQTLNSALSAAASQDIEADVQTIDASIVGKKARRTVIDVRLSKVLLP